MKWYNSRDETKPLKKTQNMATIHMAISNDQDVSEVLFPLDREDINVNMVDWNGNSCLALASKYSPRLARKLLKEPTVDINLQNHQGRTALHIAILNGNIRLVKRFLKRYDLDMTLRDKMGQTPYSLAQMKCKKKIAKLLKERLLEERVRA